MSFKIFGELHVEEENQAYLIQNPSTFHWECHSLKEENAETGLKIDL